jgi:hypothetical protein
VNILYLLQAALVIFSLFAGLFWSVSAFGRTFFFFPWKTPRPVPASHLATHQAKWNAWAAFCATAAAVAQAFTFLILHPLTP